MEAKSSNLSVLLEEGVKRGRVRMDFETEIRFGSDMEKIIRSCDLRLKKKR